MALWLTTSQIGIRRDIQITTFQTNQKFTVRKKISFKFFSLNNISFCFSRNIKLKYGLMMYIGM